MAYGLRSLEVCYLNNSPPKSETYRKGLCCMKQIGKLDLQKCALDFIVNTVCGYIRGFAFKQNSSKYQHSSNPSNNNWVLKYIIKTTRSSLTLLKVLGEQENVVTVKSRYQIVTTTKAWNWNKTTVQRYLHRINSWQRWEHDNSSKTYQSLQCGCQRSCFSRTLSTVLFCQTPGASRQRHRWSHWHDVSNW